MRRPQYARQTSRPVGMIAEQDFTRIFGPVCRQRTEYCGACTSVRVWYEGEKKLNLE